MANADERRTDASKQLLYNPIWFFRRIGAICNVIFLGIALFGIVA